MSLRKLPEPVKITDEVRATLREHLQFDPSPAVMARYRVGIRMEAAAGDNVVEVIGIIGEDWFGQGVTVGRVLQRLKEIGPKPVVVLINSPGGDFFEGQAIYNALRLHPAEVTVRILGVAASAASIIAMAGDVVEIPDAGWLMIHNVSVGDYGDRHYKRGIADTMEMFDDVSARVYADRSGLGLKEVKAMMDSETFMSGKVAVDNGFADALLDPAALREEKATDNAAQQMDAALQKAGLSRSARRSLASQFVAFKLRAAGDNGTLRAANGGTPSASGPVLVSAKAAQSITESIAALDSIISKR